MFLDEGPDFSALVVAVSSEGNRLVELGDLVFNVVLDVLQRDPLVGFQRRLDFAEASVDPLENLPVNLGLVQHHFVDVVALDRGEGVLADDLVELPPAQLEERVFVKTRKVDLALVVLDEEPVVKGGQGFDDALHEERLVFDFGQSGALLVVGGFKGYEILQGKS